LGFSVRHHNHPFCYHCMYAQQSKAKVRKYNATVWKHQRAKYWVHFVESPNLCYRNITGSQSYWPNHMSWCREGLCYSSHPPPSLVLGKIVSIIGYNAMDYLAALKPKHRQPFISKGYWWCRWMILVFLAWRFWRLRRIIGKAITWDFLYYYRFPLVCVSFSYFEGFGLKSLSFGIS